LLVVNIDRDDPAHLHEQVAAALRALRDEGLLEMRPRRGIRMIGTPAESQLHGKVAELVPLARQHGYTRTELNQMITDAP
jgi:hypothetical protein